MPTVSIIVPNYNHARFLRQRIDTILGQTFQDFELILLDDCSTDESR
jgi:glycosyltransferase involved in cell wall biosynthesis